MDTSIYDHQDIATLLDLALAEDLGQTGDCTVACLVAADARLEATITAKEAGVICGLPLAAAVFTRCGGGVEISSWAPDGQAVAPGDVVLRAQGRADSLLSGERTLLNLAQRLSGTASTTARYVQEVHGTTAGIYDTRKTTPGMRLLQKHAVRAGGGHNHRIGLYDMVLIKENHIALMGASGPAEAVSRCRRQLGHEALIEVEIENLKDLEPVIAAGADMVLCDNMGPELLRQAVGRRNAAQGSRRVELEASGGITLTNLRAIAETGIERISIGALTHSVSSLDLSMRCQAKED